MIRAITFDFWDTIVANDSDEPRRKAAGLATKAQDRERLFVDEVLTHYPSVGRVAATQAHTFATEQFNSRWKNDQVTPSVAERLTVGLVRLGLPKTPEFEDLVHAYEMMEVITPPTLAPGIGAALRDLSEEYRLGIISDTFVTPGIGLRQILQEYGLYKYFSHFVFSDEVGCSKPTPKVFELAAQGLAVPLDALAHVGDREENDIAGALSVGSTAILYTGASDRDSANTKAHIHCEHHNQLATLIAAHKKG